MRYLKEEPGCCSQFRH